MLQFKNLFLWSQTHPLLAINLNMKHKYQILKSIVAGVLIGFAQSGYCQVYRYMPVDQTISSQKIPAWAQPIYNYQVDDHRIDFPQPFIAQFIGDLVDSEKLATTSLFISKLDKDVKTYQFESKFRMPDYPDISFEPRNFKEDKLDEYKVFVQTRKHSLESSDIFKQQNYLLKAQEQFAFAHPGIVALSWDSIPDAPIPGRYGFLKRRSARDGINLLLHEHSYNTQPSLKKVTISKGPWTLGGTENIQLSQGYIDNWVKGGESNVSLASDLRLNANFNKGKHEWENYIIHKVGVISTDNDKGRVNTDLIEINTKYGHKASEKWYYSFLYNFKTQFFYGYDKADDDKSDPVSGFMAPAYMSFALGMDFKPSKKFTLLLSPVTTRITLVADTIKFDQTKFGIPEGKSSEVVNGISVVNNFEYEMSKEVKLSSRLDAFYQYLGKVPVGQQRQVQIDWEVIMDMRINRFFSTRLLAHARYFTNESDKIQFRQNFNIAFKYHF